jgi:hypothetical protein
MNHATPLRPAGCGQHAAISCVGVPRRSYGYAFGTPPGISPRGAHIAASGISTTGC